MERFDPPRPLPFESENLSENWRRWKEDFTFYLTAAEKETKRHKVKSTISFHSIGQNGMEICNTFVFETKEDSMVFDKTIEKLDECYISRKI